MRPGMIRRHEGTYGMKRRIMSVLIPIILVVSALIVFISCYTLNKVIIDRTTQIIENNVRANVTVMDTSLQSTLTELEAIQNCVQNSYLTEAQLKRLYENTYGKSEFYPEGLYYADSEGKYYDGTKDAIDTSFDSKGQVWFEEGLLHTDGFAYGDIYYDEKTGEDVVTASVNTLAGQQKRVIAANVPVSIYRDYIADITFFHEKGYTFLVDLNTYKQIGGSQNYIEMTAKDGKAKKDFMGLEETVIEKIKAGDFETDLIAAENESYYVVIGRLEQVNWALIGFVSKGDAVTEETIHIVWQVCAYIAVLLVLAIIIFDRVIGFITRQLKAITMYINDISNGDFTKRLELKSKDEIGTMVGSLNRFIEKLSGIFVNVDEVAKTLYQQSDSSNELSSLLLESSTKQQDVTEDMSHALGQINGSIEDIVDNSNELAKSVEQVNGDCTNMFGVLVDCMEDTKKGKSEMEGMVFSIREIQDTIMKLQSSVEAVGSGMKNIGILSDVLDEIASKSNLLSLNASIEAARSSNNGNGFGVVANEMGALSKMSAESVVKIKSVIDEINELVKQMLSNMHQSVDQIRECSAKAVTTSSTFDEMNTSVSGARDKVESVNGYMQVLAEMSVNLKDITNKQLATSQAFLGISENVMEHAAGVRNHAALCEEEAKQLRIIVNQLRQMLQEIQYQR